MNDAKIPSFSEYCFAKKAKYLLNRMQESHHEMTCKFIYHDVDSRVEKEVASTTTQATFRSGRVFPRLWSTVNCMRQGACDDILTGWFANIPGLEVYKSHNGDVFTATLGNLFFTTSISTAHAFFLYSS